jgi:tetratricopeptide (TPR) repeat protein
VRALTAAGAIVASRGQGGEVKRLFFGAVLGSLVLAAGAASATCTVNKAVELPVTMSGLRPLVPVKVDGWDEMFLADSGANYSFISPTVTKALDLKQQSGAVGSAEGVGGESTMYITVVKDFTIAGTLVHNVEFLTLDNGLSDAGGVIGVNILGLADTEFDLANGVIRLLKPQDCGDAMLAYWRSPPAPYSALSLSVDDARVHLIRAKVSVNGARLQAIFDTGASFSYIDRAAAARAGIHLDAPQVTRGGSVQGIGGQLVQSWIAPVESVQFGDAGNEKILHTKVRVADLSGVGIDMVLGADFFLSHHVLAAWSQHRLYFTYNGGPVFNLDVQPGTPSAPAGPEITDAAELARHAAARVSRQDFAGAIADLTRAVDSAPTVAEYRVGRAGVYMAAGQPSLARPDLDRALQLAPANVDALMLRASLRGADGDRTGALADLAAVDKTLPAESDQRLALADHYQAADAFDLAIGQYDGWIKGHPGHGAMASALNGRCWTRAKWGRELDKALADCDAALRLVPRNPMVLDSRGLARLRMGDADKSIADYDAGLAVRSNNAWSLYGRGLARLRKGQTDPGKADIAAATVIDPKIASEFAKFGVTP